MEYITYILCFIAGLWIGYRVNDIIMKVTFGKMLEEAGVTNKDLDKLIKHWKPKMEAAGLETPDQMEEIEIKIEKHNDTLYAFRKDTDQFLGQGASKEDLIKALSYKFNNVRLLIDKNDGAEFIGGHFKL